MLLIICAATLFWCGGVAGHDYVGNAVNLPKHNLLSGDMTGGFPVFKNLPSKCIRTAQNPQLDGDTSFYEDTSSFYSSLGTYSSISGELRADFTMSATLDATTKSISGSKRTVRGTTYHSYAKISSDFLQMKCLRDVLHVELDDTLRKDFEALPAFIDNPSPASSWVEYKLFFENYGTHIVKQVFYGSSFYQHAFSDSANNYTEKELNAKACVSFGYSIANASVCNGITQKDIDAASNLKMSEKFIARGGKDETRAKMYTNRSDELIVKFLSEANETHQPIQYEFTPLWVILKSRYINTSHFTKAFNMEAYYKGYKNYGCALRTDGIVLQKFHYSNQSTQHNPILQCSIAPEGCRSNDDCHYRNAWWCECSGDSCVRYKKTKLNTGVERYDAEIFTGHDFAWQGCGGAAALSCTCKHPKHKWKTVWTSSDEDHTLAYALHSVEKKEDERIKMGKIAHKERNEL